jgi:hypothetical protein
VNGNGKSKKLLYSIPVEAFLKINLCCTSSLEPEPEQHHVTVQTSLKVMRFRLRNVLRGCKLKMSLYYVFFSALSLTPRREEKYKILSTCTYCNSACIRKSFPQCHYSNVNTISTVPMSCRKFIKFILKNARKLTSTFEVKVKQKYPKTNIFIPYRTVPIL